METEPTSSAPAALLPPRRSVLAVGAVAALAAGAGAYLWRGKPAVVAQASLLWTTPFEAPDGAPLNLDALRGKPLLVNFWATWCPPCVAELPMLDAFWRQHTSRGWGVLGIAVDQPSSVRAFLARLPVGFPIGMAGLEGTSLSRAFGNAEGGLPFTVVFDKGGSSVHRKMGQLTPADLVFWSTS